MADYIDREELLKCANAQSKVLRGDMLLFVQDMIKSQRPINAVEVVRCKDCRYREITNVMNFCKRLCEIEKDTDVIDRAVYLEIYDNDYCKWGEKE